jgi:UV DNA damage endonuclease
MQPLAPTLNHTAQPQDETWPVQLGLCCANTVLQAQRPPVYAARTMTLEYIRKRGMDALRAKVRDNLKDVLTMMEWNHRHNIFVFRLSSDLFPHYANPKLHNMLHEMGEVYTMAFAADLLHAIGEKARLLKQRLTFHPGQFNVIGTPYPHTFAATVAELSYHADMLDMMQCGADSVMVVHFGGTYGNKAETVERWVRQFHLLPPHVQMRLVIENCEKSFSVEDCLALSDKTLLPVVFDTHHHECYRAAHPEEGLADGAAYVDRILHTWQRRGIKPKFHVSEQGEGKVGKHSDYVETLPAYLLWVATRDNVKLDIMIEAKAKEQAIFKLYKKYGKLLHVPADQLYPAPRDKNKNMKKQARTQEAHREAGNKNKRGCCRKLEKEFVAVDHALQ